ncbi:MAG: prephenate dehydrogenase/arogenate dehydrogenase family protein, partial [Chloroflexota bacterium]|nr:prephenate dehydrogenase/arogenate dehydrogenase family protein [Chloroflexota bacterium]
MKIGIAGLGLIGGSLALALRDKHEVTGYDTDERARATAKADGIRIAARLEDLLPADAVLVATPISTIVPTLEHLAARSDGAVLLDTGSLKRTVAEYAARAPVGARIVGGHPMAGTTSAGFSAADPGLFRGRAFLLVPT